MLVCNYLLCSKNTLYYEYCPPFVSYEIIEEDMNAIPPNVVIERKYYVASVGGQQDSIEMRYEDENIWLTQRMMATLYDVGLPTINEHSNIIFK